MIYKYLNIVGDFREETTNGVENGSTKIAVGVLWFSRQLNVFDVFLELPIV